LSHLELSIRSSPAISVWCLFDIKDRQVYLFTQPYAEPS